MRYRSIPTCVGTTRPDGNTPSGFPVHPHVRGDYRVPGTQQSSGGGPSPRAWGLQPLHLALEPGGRSIPTCVGTTTRPRTSRADPPVHPHVRGDYDGRGQEPRQPHLPVHPHVRGDYWGGRLGQGRLAGPSPRAWGLLGNTLLNPSRKRSIPTCVGTTGFSWPTSLLLVRSIPTCVGTTRTEATPASAIAGPSPRAWGLR